MEVVSNSSYSVIQESDNEKQPSVEAMGFTRLNLAANCAAHHTARYTSINYMMIDDCCTLMVAAGYRLLI